MNKKIDLVVGAVYYYDDERLVYIERDKDGWYRFKFDEYHGYRVGSGVRGFRDHHLHKFRKAVTLDEMKKVDRKKTIWRNIKMWVQIILCISPIVACNYWLIQDDQRMYDSFMKSCEERKVSDKTKSDIDCGDAFFKAYRETFGRSP